MRLQKWSGIDVDCKAGEEYAIESKKEVCAISI